MNELETLTAINANLIAINSRITELATNNWDLLCASIGLSAFGLGLLVAIIFAITWKR